MHLNRLDLYGTVAHAPTVRFTPNGFAYTDLTITAGFPQDPAVVVEVPVHLTGEVAQLAGQHLQAGDGIVLWGPLTQLTHRRRGIEDARLRITGDGFIRTRLTSPANIAFNRVNLYGHLTEEPTVHGANSNRPEADLLLTVPVPGNPREVVTVPVRLAGRLAQQCAATVHADDPILVWGYLDQQTWQASQGQAIRTRLRVVAVGFQHAAASSADQPDAGAPDHPATNPAGTTSPRTAVGQAFHAALERKAATAR